MHKKNKQTRGYRKDKRQGKVVVEEEEQALNDMQPSETTRQTVNEYPSLVVLGTKPV